MSEPSPDEAYLRLAIEAGRAKIQPVSMRSLGTPDTRYQARVKHLDMDHVERLEQILAQQEDLAPVVVFSSGFQLILADGFHRHEVYRRKNRELIPAFLISVSPDHVEREALLYSAMCNRNLSLGRTPQDLRKALAMLFTDPECWLWSDKRLGDHCGVSGNTVRIYRVHYARTHKIEPPKSTVASNGATRVYSRDEARSKPKGHPSLVRKERNGKTTGFSCSTDKKQIFLGTNEEEAEKVVAGIADKADRKKRGLALNALKSFLAFKDLSFFPCGCSNITYPGLRGLHGHGVIFTSTEFDGYDSTVRAIGCLRMLRLYADSPESRLVVVCYPDDGPRSLIELAERDGVEFLTPEGLAESLASKAAG